MFDPSETPRQNARLVEMQRWYEPYEVLRMAAATNAQLLELSVDRNPYLKPLQATTYSGSIMRRRHIGSRGIDWLPLLATLVIASVPNGRILLHWKAW
jgi:hypothetical protein